MTIEEFDLKDRLEYTENAALTGLEKMMMPGQGKLFKVEGTEISNVTPEDYKKNGWVVAAHITGLVLLNIVALVSFVVLVIIRANLHLTERQEGYEELGDRFQVTPPSADSTVSVPLTLRGAWDDEIAELERNSVVRMQAFVRRALSRKEVQKQSRVIVTMQRVVRGGIGRKEAQKLLSIKRIQPYIRGMLERAAHPQRLKAHRRGKAAQVIQAKWRLQKELIRDRKIICDWNPKVLTVEAPLEAIENVKAHAPGVVELTDAEVKLTEHLGALRADLLKKFLQQEILDGQRYHQDNTTIFAKGELALWVTDRMGGREYCIVTSVHKYRKNNNQLYYTIDQFNSKTNMVCPKEKVLNIHMAIPTQAMRDAHREATTPTPYMNRCKEVLESL